MTTAPASVITWLNTLGNALFAPLQGPLRILPAWLSLTVLSAALGIVMLIVFKHTSNQAAIGEARNAVKAQLLAMKLYRDNVPVVLNAQARILLYAGRLLLHSMRPMAVMMIPLTLVLSQLGLWYQSRPLAEGEQVLVMLQLADSEELPMPGVVLQPSDAGEVTAGPVRVPSKRQIFWHIQAGQAGSHVLAFRVAGETVRKQLAVGVGLMRVSRIRPGPRLTDQILHPAEQPFTDGSPIQSIRIYYPERPSPVTGTDAWLLSLFVISMAAALVLKPVLKVAF